MASNPIDVWLRFDDDETDEATYEANTFERGGGYVVEWYHVDVGQVTEVHFDSLAEAYDWLERTGYQDFTS